MKPIETTRLLKPLEGIDLAEGEWSAETSLSFCIPMCRTSFDEYFEGLPAVSDAPEEEDGDYATLYLNYYFEHGSYMELYIDYANYSGNKEGYEDFGITVTNWDEGTDRLLRELLAPLKNGFLLDKWKEFSDVPFDDTDPLVDMAMDEDWWMWKKGTDRNAIWEFFDEEYSHGVYSLLYNGGRPVLEGTGA